MTTEQQTMTYKVGTEIRGWRLDQFLAYIAPEYSRSRWQMGIKKGAVKLNGKTARSRDIVYPGDIITGNIIIKKEIYDYPQNISLNICYQDDDIIIINKQSGLVVHPAAGNPDGTLLNALLYRFPELNTLPRAGIVHRLDKDTSGLMVVARNLRAHAHLINQLQERIMGRTYLALVYRYVTAGDTVNLPLGRHPHDRIKMAVRKDGKEAITHYRIEERYGEIATLLRVHLETGRTHQIRVHMAYLKYPLIGDPLYGCQSIIGKGVEQSLRHHLLNFPRQALHATQLILHHPKDNRQCCFNSPMPQDMKLLLEELRKTENNRKILH